MAKQMTKAPKLKKDDSAKPVAPSELRQPNAWIVNAPAANGEPFSVAVPLDETMVRGVDPGDGVAIAEEQDGAHVDARS